MHVVGGRGAFLLVGPGFLIIDGAGSAGGIGVVFLVLLKSFLK